MLYLKLSCLRIGFSDVRTKLWFYVKHVNTMSKFLIKFETSFRRGRLEVLEIRNPARPVLQFPYTLSFGNTGPRRNENSAA